MRGRKGRFLPKTVVIGDAMDVTKPYKFIRFGAMDVTKPHIFIGFGAMDVTKPYKFIGFGAIYVVGVFVGAPCSVGPDNLPETCRPDLSVPPPSITVRALIQKPR